mgnify:CR=1 FL=1
MNKFGKMRVIAAFTLALTMLASVAAPSFASAEGESVIKSFEPRAVEIDGENEALSGWQYYFYNASLKYYYQSNELFVRATKNGRTGNAMEIERKKATDELWVSSYSFAVKPDTEYNISSFVKTTDSSCKLVWCVKELDENGNDVADSATNGSTQYIDRYSFGGKYDNWTETSFTRKTEATTKKMILRIRAEGTGIINIDDITVKPSNAVKFGLQSFGSANYDWQLPVKERPAETLTSAQISSESSDNDGASLKLDTGKYFSNIFGMLPYGKSYTLSFKYKTAYAGRLAVRIDNMNPKGERDYWADKGNIAIAPSDEWQTYTYNFTTQQGQTDVQWMEMNFADCAGDAFILIDELKVVGTDDDGKTMQYIANGSFSGAYTEGYFYAQNANIAKQEDGSSVIMIGNANLDKTSGAAGYLNIDTTHLTTGKKYTLKFDYRAGEAESSARIYYGTYWKDQVALSVSAPAHNVSSWASASVDFVAGAEVTDNGDHTVRNSSRLEIYSQPYGKPTYMRNFSIVDEEGNEFITNKTLVAPDKQSSTIYTANFGAGSADYTWKDWNIVNGGIYGLTFEDGNKDYKVCLNGSAGNPATAVTKDIDVAGARLISVDKKIYYTADPAFGSNLTVTVLAGENEIKADKNGYFSLPEGTTTIKVKFSTEEYVTFKKVFVKFTGIGTAAGASIRANTPYGIRWTVRVKTAEWNKLVATYGEANVKAGVIIAPLDYLGSGETAVPFTIDAFKAANKKYVDIVTDTFNAKLENKVEGYSGFYASLVNIKAGNLNREFIARSYVAVTKDGVTAYYYGEYSAEDNARTIYEVGKGAIASDAESENVKTFVKNEVLDKIADVTVKDGVAAMTAINGYTSPYSVSINGKVLTITVMDGADVNLSEVLKIVCVNGKNYKPTVSGNLATVTIN